MGKKYHKYLLLVFTICVCGLTNDLKAQQRSLVGEIFDFDIGDVFHYKYYNVAGNPSEIDSAINNLEIIGKYYSITSDTVFYIRNIIRGGKISPADWRWEYSEYKDTLQFFNLNDTLFSDPNPSPLVISVYSDNNRYNGRLINQSQYTPPYNTYIDWVVVGCGFGGSFHSSTQGNYQGSEELVYFKKGLEEWGVPNPVTIDSVEYSVELEPNFQFSVYPNPTSGIIKIDPDFVLNGSIYIYSALGEQMKFLIGNSNSNTTEIRQVVQVNSGITEVQLSFVNVISEITTLDISGLPAGMYIVYLVKDGLVSYEKIIKQ